MIFDLIMGLFVKVTQDNPALSSFVWGYAAYWLLWASDKACHFFPSGYTCSYNFNWG